MNDSTVSLEVEWHVEGGWDDDVRYQQAALWIAEQYQLSSLSASIAIVDDPTIHRLNREHLQHDWPTDVISFVFEDSDGNVQGEVIASVDTATRLAAAAGWNPADELLLYIVHGMLHLAGLDDISSEDQLEMRTAERDCLLAIGVPLAKHHLERWKDVSY